ncbi:NADPH:quinone oxidoreductase family protein [Phycicoccus avicenniae]|uniref:NADPH:quinone oxidoreductase family protein n=1 Tax=Phycicoccus avicenniae TaxID=2828860 RepID=UPI003D264E25
MRAAQVTRLDGPESVEVLDLPDPQERDGAERSVVVDVAAAGVCFPDVLLTRGQYQMKPDPPFVPGSEVAGVVRSAPAGSGFSAGDRVAAFPVLGGFAEAVAVDPAMVFPLPDDTPWDTAAALPMNYLTCEFALGERARLREGETVLVHGAAGGVGTAAIQLAAARGARVLAVVSTDAKAEVARAAGADEVVLAEGFRDAVSELTSGRGVDVVVDPVGGDRFTDSLRSLGPGGRLLVIGFTAGSIPEVKVNRLLLNNISVVGVGWGAWWTHPHGPGAGYLREQWDRLVPLLASGAVAPVIGEVRSLDEVVDALLAVEQRRAQGKVLLTP